MKFYIKKWVLVLGCFSGPLFAQDASQATAEAILKTSCGTCHTSAHRLPFVTDDKEVIWETIEANAELIKEMVSSKRMPPARAPASAKITDEQRADFLAYIETLIAGPKPEPQEPVVQLEKLTLPPGFAIEVFAQAKGARSLAVHASGLVFVGTGGTTTSGPTDRIYALLPPENGRAAKVVTFITGLNSPNGVALHGNDLYVAEAARIIRFADAVTIAQGLSQGVPAQAPAYEVIKGDFPVQSNHYWKYLAIGPDEKIYVPIGADCNVCLPDDRSTTAGIFRMNLDGTGYEQVALGVRNTVGFDWDPTTKDLWFTDNGRDMLGEDIPSDELNHLSSESPKPDFGFPYCFAKTITDPEFGTGQDCSAPTFVKPVVELGAHVASLGMNFYTGESFPALYKNQIFVAEHGSWNRTKKSGYRVRAVLKARGITAENRFDNEFISGWLDDATQVNWGRPVDVKTYSDGSLLISDDFAGVIYRVTYTEVTVD